MSASVCISYSFSRFLDSPSIRHGIHGGFNRRSQPGPPCAWWRSRGHHHLLLRNSSTSLHPICPPSPVSPKQYPRISFSQPASFVLLVCQALTGQTSLFLALLSLTLYCSMKCTVDVSGYLFNAPSAVAFLHHLSITALTQSGEAGGLGLICFYLFVLKKRMQCQ